MTELADLAARVGWTWLLPAIVAVLLAKTILDLAITSSEKMRAWAGWYGHRVAARQERRRTQADTIAELQSKVEGLEHELATTATAEDLRTEVDQLAYQLRLLRWRAEMTDAYLVEDADFHRTVALTGVGGLPAHTSFPAFEREWAQAHPRPMRRRTDRFDE